MVVGKVCRVRKKAGLEQPGRENADWTGGSEGLRCVRGPGCAIHPWW